MNIFSHLRLASRLIAPYGGARKNAKTLAFLFGNIRPDLFGGFLLRPHTPAARAASINKKIERCLTEACNGEHGGIYANYRLGVICHFLTDFFCYAHNDWSTLSGRGHFAYEMQLGHMLHSSPHGTTDVPEPAQDVDAVIRSIWQSHEEYSRLYPHPSRDIAYALDVCAYLLSSARYLAYQGGYYPFEAMQAPVYG